MICSLLNCPVVAMMIHTALLASAPPIAHHSAGLACSPSPGGVSTRARQAVSATASRIENKCVPSVVAAGRTMAILTAAVTAALVPARAAAAAIMRGMVSGCVGHRQATAVA